VELARSASVQCSEETLQIVVGAAMPVGLNRNADNHGAFLYLSIEHDFF
jgi:hypothetical protein